MKFSLIAAISRNNTLGNEGQLPWKSKADMQRFVKITSGHPIIMGRKTWQSLNGKPLKGRLNVVISSQDIDLPAGCFQFNSFDQAIIQLHKTYPTDAHTAFIIGGAQIYNEALSKGVPDKMYLTFVESDTVQGDTKFDPFLFHHQWNVLNSVTVPKGEDEEHDVTFVDYEKIKVTAKKRFVKPTNATSIKR